MHIIFVGIAQPQVFLWEPHSHPEWEITYCFSGNGTLTIGNEELLFDENDIILQPPEIPHSEYAEQGFRDIFVTVADFVNPWSKIPRFHDNSDHDYYNILMQMYRVFHLKQKNWLQVVDSLFDVLYQYLIAWDKPSKKHAVVEDFEEVLIANITNADFKIDRSLSEISVSTDYFRKIFKEQTGKTPIEYLTSKRLDYAKQLLASDSSLPYKIKEIAYMSGYSDPYYFSRLFKNKTGKSPTEWPPGAVW